MSLTPAQIEMRKTGIGASEAPMVFGESPHGGPVALYLRKVGLEAASQSDEQEMGNLLEPAIARYYAQRTSARLRPATTYRHPECPWMLATPDRWVGRRKLLQIKCVGTWMAHHWRDADDGIPDYVRIQVTQEMDVCGVRLCDVAALIGGTQPRIYQVDYDAELAALIREETRRFWYEHVEPRVPPAPDGTEESDALLRALYPRERTPMVAATPAMDAIGRELVVARREAGAWAARRAVLEQEMKRELGNAEGAEGDGWSVTWTATAKGTRVFRFVADEDRKRGKAA